MNLPEKITAQSTPEQLPDDAGTLKQMVLTLLGQIDDLYGQLYYLKRQLFGPRSEKLDPAQRLLFENLYAEIESKIEAGKPKTEKPKSKPNENHPGRNPLPKDLPRETIEIEPSDEEKVCDTCHTPKQRIGEEVTDKLEFVPASFTVKSYVRHKYACKQCQGKVSIGSLPPMAIDKGVAGEGLLAHILTSKYMDHIPLNRLEGILKRHNVHIPVSCMSDWVGRCAELLGPLVKRMRQKILASPKIHTDDTPIPVKSKQRKGSTARGYLWVYLDDAGHAVFDFTPSRSREGPKKFLGDYSGYIQADAYSGYNILYEKGNATEVACHAHARRKFEYALDSDPVRSARMLTLWGRLYEIERRAKQEKYDAEALLNARQQEAVPILEEIRAALKEYKTQTLPKSPVGKAVTYSLNQWEALVCYTTDACLSIDNNLSERTLRQVVIGRKNYLFAGSPAGARRAAIIYSLTATCKLHGIDPFAYLQDVLKKVSTHPASKIDDLLPSNWTPPEKNEE